LFATILPRLFRISSMYAACTPDLGGAGPPNVDACPPPKSARNAWGNIWGNKLQIWRNSAKRPQQNDTPKLRSWLAVQEARLPISRVRKCARSGSRKNRSVERFKLDDEQRRRLVVQERG
jgi:hypothetical protein